MEYKKRQRECDVECVSYTIYKKRETEIWRLEMERRNIPLIGKRWILCGSEEKRESYMPHLGSYIRRERERQIGWEVDEITKKETHPPFQTQNELETNE